MDKTELIIRKAELEGTLEEMIKKQRPKKEWGCIVKELTTVRLELKEI